MSKITRKSYKRKKILMGVSLFGAVGLVSTGFAAWVLSTSTTTHTDPTLSVGTVSDKGMQFSDVKTYDGSAEATTYIFEPAKDDLTGRVRFDGTNSERLTLTVKGNLSNADVLGKLSAKLTFTGGGQLYEKDGKFYNPETGALYTSTDGDAREKSGLEDAVALGMVVLPTCATETDLYVKSGANICSFTMDSGTKVGSFSYNVSFAWGTAFDSKNPSVFYDSEGHTKADDVSDEEVKGNLNALHELLDGVQLTLTLTADPD